jgi:hypothetical protein
MTPDQLSAIRARLDAATPGPWFLDNDLDVYTKQEMEDVGSLMLFKTVYSHHRYGPPGSQPWHDTNLMAHAPTDLRALLDEVERLKAREESLVKQVVAQIGLIGRQAEWREGAFKRGAEAMRTALLQRVSWGSDLADRIRAEPVPEDK